jgi:hypothetical protein
LPQIVAMPTRSDPIGTRKADYEMFERHYEEMIVEAKARHQDSNASETDGFVPSVNPQLSGKRTLQAGEARK